MATYQFWQGLMIGAALNALLTIAFSLWQERRDKDTTPRTINTKKPCK